MQAVRDCLRQATDRLKPLSESPSLDAQVLVSHILGQSRAWVIAHPEAELNSAAEEELAASLSRLEAGVPLPYVIGHWEFYGLDLLVTPDVLIPRPETELLVAQALDWLSRQPPGQSAVDIGAGSGCIGIALAVHSPSLHITAIDRSAAALKVAQANAERHHVAERMTFIESNLLQVVESTRLKGQGPAGAETFDFQPSTFNLLVANLPYIPSGDLSGLAVARGEPRLALDGGADGLALIRRLLIQAPPWLKPDGLILLEIEERQGPAALQLAHAAFPAAAAAVLADLSGRPRLLRIEGSG
jgi:release factor glutamine methyltransferase